MKVLISSGWSKGRRKEVEHTLRLFSMSLKRAL